MEHKPQTTKHKTKDIGNVPYSVSHVPFQRGFSLIELVVAIAIFTIITSVVSVSQRRFGGNVFITSLAYDVALSIRQAQVYGISVRKTGGVPPAEQFDKSYGIRFKPSGSYILFADVDKDGAYDVSDDGSKCNVVGGECVSFFRIEQGNLITKFCGDADCTDNNKIDELAILFRRPDPEPTIRGFLSGVATNTYTNAAVTVTSPVGLNKFVCVSVSGQIYIKQKTGETCP